jgi:chloramphenicol 3-O phosphotransferase
VAAPGKIILVNGASSSGKSTLCARVQAELMEPFWHWSIDHLVAAQTLPDARIKSGEFTWSGMRRQFFDGFHATLPALADSGNNLLVEHIVETEEWMARLVQLLRGFDVFYVALHCPLPELERRERERGDRRLGDARKDFESLHRFGEYDLELDSANALEANSRALIAAWQERAHPSAFERMAAVY